MKKNHYIVLGISQGASEQKIKQAYRDMAKRYHPDSGGTDISESKFKEIQKAYEILSDGTRRALYDADLTQNTRPAQPDRADEIINARRSFRENWTKRRSFVDEFFSGWLPGSYFSRDTGTVDKELAIEMTLDPSEARDGGLFPLTVPVAEPCTWCDQSGFQYPFVCSRCRGKGWVQAQRSFSVSVPPNTKDGTEVSISLDDIGLSGVSLYLFIRIAANEWG